MRIPSPVSMSTTPSSGRIAPFRVDGISAAAFGGAIGAGLMDLGAGLKAREEEQKRHQRFASLEDFSNTQRGVDEELMNARRDSPLNDGNYYDRANSIIDNNMNKFLDRLPPEQQEEFRLRATEEGNRLKLGELAFDFAKKDTFYKEKVTKEISAQKDEVYKDPTKLEGKRAFLKEIIMTSGASEADKMAQIDLMNNELETAGYRAEYKQLKQAPLAAQNNAGAYAYYTKTGVSPIIAAAVVGNLAVESINFAPDVVSGHRTGDDGTAVGIAQWRHERLAALRRFAAERGTSSADLKTQLDFVFHEMQTGSDKGAAKAYALMQKATSVDEATEIFMKYYERPANSSSLAKRQAAAHSVHGSTAEALSLEDDPRFSNVHYEDRITLQNQVDADINRETAEANRVQKAAHDSFLNEMYTGLMDGKLGRADVDAARKSGMLTDYDEIEKANKIIKSNEEDAKYVNYANAKSNDTAAIWDPKNEDDRKGLNALFGRDGAKALDSRDTDIAASLVNQMSRQSMIAPDALSHLNAMTVSQNWDQQRYAFDVLSQLRTASPDAFNKAMTEEDLKRLSLFESRVGVTPDDELRKILQGPKSQEEIAIKDFYIEQAKEYLTKNFKTVEDVAEKFNGWFEGVSQRPNAVAALDREYRQLFQDGYGKTGSPKDADKYAMDLINAYWGVTDVGGQSILMKYPPAKAGYPTINGTHDWMREQLMEKFIVHEGEQFELISDRTTEAEFGSGRPVSYRVSVYKDGGWSSSDKRVTFEVTPRLIKKQEEYIQGKQNMQRAEQTYFEYQEALGYSGKTGIPVPKELQDRYNEAVKLLYPEPAPSGVFDMGNPLGDINGTE